MKIITHHVNLILKYSNNINVRSCLTTGTDSSELHNVLNVFSLLRTPKYIEKKGLIQSVDELQRLREIQEPNNCTHFYSPTYSIL